VGFSTGDPVRGIPPEQEGEPAMQSKYIVLYIVDQVLSLISAGIALFWSAGRLNWWAAWAALAMWVAWFVATDIVLLRFNPALMAERLAPPKGAKAWDRAILSIIRLTQLARYILAGLDQRYGWTGGFPLAAQIAGLTVCVLSYMLVTWAMACNAFFSQVVRIQSDRDHVVISGGPYRYVRHPAYAGMVLFELAISTLLASWWALLAGGLCALLLLLRTVLEDITLLAELPGYGDYAHRVRYRLLPGVW
jgi:protein-S-isoprenylcysteine O-methyltransferase Ste14